MYVVSVKAFHDRIAHVRRELGRHGIPFQFVFEFDAEELDAEALARFDEPKLGLPHKSLVLKHLHAWRLACMHGHRRVLVLEDDVLLHARFGRLLRDAVTAAGPLAPGWLIFLGGADTKVPEWFFREPGPLIPLPIATAEAYVTDLEACRRRLAWCESNRIRLPADHLVRRIDAETGIRQYWLPEAAVEQGSVTGRFRSALDAGRIKHGALYNAARYRWMKFKRRKARKWWSMIRCETSKLRAFSSRLFWYPSSSRHR